MRKRSFAQSLVATAVFVSMLFQGTWVLAGTTGTLTGIVTATDTGVPVSAMRVTAISPSQSATTTTDNGGHFVFASLAPDTYVVSAEKSGYEPATLSGITIQADQTRNVGLTTRRQLQTIGRVTARSAADLVRPGTTSDVYSVTAAQQTAVQGLGGGGSLNQAYSAIASVPGVFVPTGQTGIYQSVYVRGGNFTQLGYEFDGVPIQRAFDQYPSTALSSLGQQELQVYTGASPADAQSTGLSGFVNQVIKTGTYPGFANLNLSLGTPAFYHKAQFEFGGATPSRNMSWYVGVAGYNQEYRFASQYNGAELDPYFGTLYNIVAANCGTPRATAGCGPLSGGYHNAAGLLGVPLAPQGYALGPFIYGFTNGNADREAVLNLHFGIPHKRDGGKDDVQVLFDNSYLFTPFQTSLNDWGNVASNVLNGSAQFNGTTVSNCALTGGKLPCALLGGYNTTPQPPGTPNFGPFAYFDTTVYNGPMGTALTPSLLGRVQNYYFPNSSQGRSAFSLIPASQRDSYDNRASIFKIQYQKNFGSNAFARVYGYTFYSDWLQNGADSLLQKLTGAVSSDYELITHTRGVVGTFVDQWNPQNLLNFTGGYTYATTTRWNNTWFGAPANVAVAVNANSPRSGLCYAPTINSAGTVTGMTPTYCASTTVAAYALPAPSTGSLSLAPTYKQLTAANIGSFTCGTGPCEFYTVENGMQGAYNNVAPAFTNFELEDTFKPNERLNLNAGVRFDDFRYNLNDTTVPGGPEPQAVSANPRVLWQNSYNLWHCVQKGAVVAATAPDTCPAGFTPANVSVVSPAVNDYRVWSPRLGATYTFSPLDVLRASWGEYAQPASSAFQQYNNAQYNLPDIGPNTAFYPLGFFNPTHQVYPEESYNLDLSWEHQQRNSDVSWKVTPFLRKTRNELYQVLLDPRTNFTSSINIGALTATGAEFLLRKGDFSRNGWSGQLAYTYTYGTVKFGTLPTGGTVLDGINANIKTYNAYTSYCASHAKSNLCGATTFVNGSPSQGGPASGSAAACFTPAGVPDPSCGKGDIANPYWNNTPQGLFDAGASYIAYNQLPGTGLSSVSSSYIVPHVATLLLNYKHDKVAITPALQMTAGGRYGSPVQGIGVDPATCSAGLAGHSVTGDPRYPNGAPGGLPYNAASCTGSLTTPNWQTGHYDNFGAFVEPTALALSTQVTYNVSNRVTLRLTAANLWTDCIQGGNHPWTSIPFQGTAGCWYATPAQYIGNFYNPGDQVQQFERNSYGPQFGNVFQQTYGAQANPFQLFLTAEMKL